MRLALALTALLLAGCDDRPKVWTAWVYPDAPDLTKSVKLEGFKTFEQCQSAALNTLTAFVPDGTGDYECGYQCRYDPGSDLSTCAETRK